MQSVSVGKSTELKLQECIGVGLSPVLYSSKDFAQSFCAALDKKQNKEVQIDIVGTPVEGNEYLIGSCKYRNEKIGVEELELLRRNAAVFRRDGTFHYYIFSKGGFTPALLEAEKRKEVTLVTLENLYQ